MILLVDNYDSFTYNLLQLCPEETVVLRNDDPELFIVAKEADAIIFPGTRPSRRGRIHDFFDQNIP